MSDIVLTKDQADGVDTLMAFTVGNTWAMRLEGKPGVGKTTLLKEFVRRCPKRIRVTAPTNKATRVCRALVGDEFPHVTFSTTFQALGLVMSNNAEIKKIFKPDVQDSLEGVDLLLVDEGSMVGHELFGIIEGECRSRGLKVIFIGDRFQAPPVTEEDNSQLTFEEYEKEVLSPVFDIEENVTLTKILRQAELNPIINLLEEIRLCIPEGRWPEFKTAANDEGGVYVMAYPNFCKQMRAGFASPTYKNTDNSFKAVAWTNNAVNGHNQQIRRSIYGPEEACNPFILGERVIAAQRVNPVENAPFPGKMFTDQEGIVEDIKVGNHPLFSAPFKVWNLTISTEDGYVSAYVLHSDGSSAYEDHLAELVAQARARKIGWPLVYDFKEAFHDIRPCHAVTAHKSQGSTYENVFVDVADLKKNPDKIEALMLLNVAISRGSKRVMLHVGNQ